MKTTLVADPPAWPDWSVTAGIASVAGTLARMREREATYGYREADSSLTPAVEGLRELTVAGGDGAAALANAAGHLATAQRCRPADDWVGDDDERRRGRMEAASAALAAARARLQGMEGTSSKLPVPLSGALKAVLRATTMPTALSESRMSRIRPPPPPS